ncbi:MAG: hypothetical protein ABEJ72_10275 [Candidatus Aenigmatarchaeota archaeon]
MSDDSSQNGPDLDKIKKIIRTLREFPEGIWIRKLSRESELPLSTVHYYIDNVLDSFIVSEGARDSEGNFFGLRLLKLKDGVENQLESGRSIQYLLKTNDILTD